jgi:alpha/beta superfamily hydrolase
MVSCEPTGIGAQAYSGAAQIQGAISSFDLAQTARARQCSLLIAQVEFFVMMIPSPAGLLEAQLEQPACATRAIVICHPHPQYGGNMHDVVVGTVDSVARRHGFATLRFNFRGVGASTGRFDSGIGEVDDLLAALAWLKERSAELPVWLAGYSFGSNIVWRCLERAGELAGALLIAPPVAVMDFAARPAAPARLTLLAGDRDDYVDSGDLLRWAHAAAPAAHVETIPDADHFFSGAHAQLARAVERAIAR